MKKLYDAVLEVIEGPHLPLSIAQELADEVAEVSAVIMRQEIKLILTGLLSNDDEDLRQAVKNVTNKL